MSDKEMKIVIPPEVLAQMEELMEPEELQAMLDELKRQVEEGTLIENSEPVDLDKLREEDPAEYALIMEALERADPDFDAIEEDCKEVTGTKYGLH